MAEYITSRGNDMIKLCRRLQSSAKERREEGLFLVEGVRLCKEAMASGLKIKTILMTPEAEAKGLLNVSGTKTDCPERLLIAEDLAEVIADTKTPQGVFCLCWQPQEEALAYDPHGKYLLLDSLQDPGNLGTIVRGAEAFGITALILSADCPDCFSPKVLRSTMGSVFRQKIFRTADLAKTVVEMKAGGFATYAATLDENSARIEALGRVPGGLAVVVGNEGSGVCRAVVEACGASVYIPMAEKIESLNAAAAATVIMWEMSGRGR